MAGELTPLFGETKKWQNLAAFTMNLTSKQFLVTLAAIAFEAYVIWQGLHLPAGVTMSEYLGLVGIVHAFLGIIIMFWFQSDNKRREIESKSNGNSPT